MGIPAAPSDSGVFAWCWTGHDILDVYPPQLARCNPEYIKSKGVGPLPPGLYDMTEFRATDGQCGPNVIVLAARAGTELYGRDGTSFRIHGRLFRAVVDSDGCIICPPSERLALWASPDHLLNVVILPRNIFSVGFWYPDADYVCAPPDESFS